MHEAWTLSDYVLMVVGAILVNNILLARFLGNCPFLGVSRKMETATGMAMAVVFVMTLAGIFTWIVQTTNCAVLGVAVINIREEFLFMQTVIFSFASAVGYGFALILFTGIREQLEVANIPEFMKGTAIGLVTAGLLSLSFFGFAGMVD